MRQEPQLAALSSEEPANIGIGVYFRIQAGLLHDTFLA